MRTTEKDKQLKAIIGEKPFNAMIEQIKRIETSVPTTKDHYGDYMAALSGMNKETKYDAANLMLYLGANQEGLKNALRLC